MKSTRSRVRMELILFAWTILVASTASAQVFTGTVSGVVRDSSGAVLPNATLTLTNVQTNQRSTQVTGDSGNFTFPLVSSGTYRLEAEAQGFKKFGQGDITVEVNQNVVVNPVLQVGNVSQTVEVTGKTPLLQPESSSLGHVVSSLEVSELPLLGRNTLSLVSLSAGVTPMGPFGGVPAESNAYNQGFFSVSGSQVLENQTLIDGVHADAAIFNTPAFVPSPADVQEFKVQTSSFSAEFGRTAGGVVNIVTKSGGNQIHGSAYEYFRNVDLDSNNWFNNRAGKPNPFNVLNQFGVAAGGPVVIPHVYNGHDKTFWFVNYEGLRDRRGIQTGFTVPTPLQLTGDFSKTFNSKGQLVTIYDPLTTRPDPNKPGNFIRDPFPGNVIPANRINQVAAKIAPLWIPNATGNFFGVGTVPNTENLFSARVDHSFKEKNKIFGRFSLTNNQRGAFDFFNDGGGWINPGGGGVPLVFNARNAAFDFERTINPTTLFDFNAGFVRQFVFKNPALTGLDLTTLGFPASFNQGIYFRALPAFSPSGFRAIAPASSDLLHRADNTESLHGAFTKVLSRQTVVFGVDGLFVPAGELQPGAPQGQFNFNSGFTGANPLKTDTASGNSFASFLLGFPSSGSADFNPAISISYTYFAGFVQDSIKVNSKLTVNAGVRYELETGRNERFNRLSWFDPNIANPLGAKVGLPNLRGGLEFVGVNGKSRRQELTNDNNFGPRLGFAYSLTPKMVIGGGYGLFFLPHSGDDTGGSLGGLGFFTNTSYVSSIDGNLTPANSLSNPFPTGFNRPVGSSQGLLTLLGQDLTTVFHTNKSAYIQDWNFGVQRELPGHFFFGIDYAGSKGTFLPVDFNLNQLPDQDLSMGTALLKQVPNPFLGQIAVGALSGPTVLAGQLLRPYPEFTNINIRAAHEGVSTYNSLQLRVQRRFSNGLSLNLAYTVSKAITDAGSRLAINFSSPGIQDSNNLRGEDSLANFDVPQRLVVSYVYELPFGPGKPFLGHVGSLPGRAIGGWQIQGITSAQRGFPLGLGTSTNNTNSFGGGSRPNFDATACPNGAGLSGSTESRVNQYFNTACFTTPAPFTFGDVARMLPNVRAPGFLNYDLSVMKNTQLAERLKLQTRAELFNAFNNVNFGAPGTTCCNGGGFGQIFSARNARIIQLALTLEF